MELKELKNLLRVLKDAGVTYYQAGDVVLTLSPEVPTTQFTASNPREKDGDAYDHPSLGLGGLRDKFAGQ